jgi:ATP-dependent Lon protease
MEMILVPRVEGDAPYTLAARGEGLFKESTQTAYFYVRSQAKRLGIPLSMFKENSIHINIADKFFSPVDGPSAGLAQVVAFVSIFTNRKIDAKTAMTGAVNLRGQSVLIGGEKEKLQGAKDAGKTRIIFPMDNKPAVDKLDQKLKDGIEIIFVSHVDEVLKLVLI